MTKEINNKKIREEFHEFSLALADSAEAGAVRYEDVEDILADFWLFHTIPRTELKQWLEERKNDMEKAKTMMLTSGGKNWKKSKKRVVGANLVLSDLTERFNLK